MTKPDFTEFDDFCEEKGYRRDQAAEAFAAWLSSKTGEPVDGIATDFSGAVHAEPEETT